MTCRKYKKLSQSDQQLFSSELLHSVRADDVLFEMAQNMITIAKAKGHFQGVKFGLEEICAASAIDTVGFPFDCD